MRWTASLVLTYFLTGSLYLFGTYLDEPQIYKGAPPENRIIF